MRLILNGGGDGDKIKKSYELFASIVNGGKIMYIPLAWENGSYEDCLKFLTKELEPYKNKITDIDLITNANQITKERLQNVTGVFVGGGNTYKLLKMLKDTEAFDNLKEFIKRKDTVVMGCSAGALIWGKSIDTCKDDGLNIKSICDVNNVGLKDTLGFNAINGYSLIVHYNKIEEQKPLIKQRIERLLKEGYELICLPEETSLYYNNGMYRIIGDTPADVFKNPNINDVLKKLEQCLKL